jgi:hypothetical protein
VLQGNTDGAFHPNYVETGDGPPDSGHGAYAAMLYARLHQDLLPNVP